MATQTLVALLVMGALIVTAALRLRSLLREHRGDQGDVDPNRPLVAYKTLRGIIGLLGVALPVVVVVWGVLIVGGLEFESSISDYYSLRTRDAFVGILFVVGWFLLAYRGYDRTDDQAGDWAWLFAMGVALFPNSGSDWEQVVHFTSAVALFLILAFFCLALFTKSDKDPADRTDQKKKRNLIYRICGWTIIGSLLATGVSFLAMSSEAREATKIVLILETVMLWAFGWSWIVKGEWIFRDVPDVRGAA